MPTRNSFWFTRAVKLLAGGWAIFCIFIGLALTAGHVLPGGTLAFSSNRPRSGLNVFLLDVNRKWIWPLTNGESNREGVVWARDGRTILFRSCAQSLDQYGCWYSAMDASGGLIEEVDALTYRNTFLGSPDGSRLAYIGDVGHSRFAIVVENQNDGSRQQLTNSDSGNAFPAWSPDGRQIAYSSDMDGNWEIYAVNADGSDLRRLTFDDAADIEPAWSPDGTRIAFSSNRNGAYNLFMMDADGSNIQPLTTGFWNDEFPKWRP